VEHKAANHHRVPATSRTPEVFFAHDADAALEQQPGWYFNTIYRHEQERGYAGLEDLWTPGPIRVTLTPGRSTHFVCSADPIDFERVLKDVRVQKERQQVSTSARAPESQTSQVSRLLASISPVADDSPVADPYLPALARAAGQFVAAGQRGGEDVTTVVSQFPWSSPSVRQGLIAFPGLFLVTGRFEEAKSYLLSLAAMLEDGVLPSEFPESGAPPKYEAADASLWLANAVHQYLQYTNDEVTARAVYSPLLGMIDALRRGTKLGLQVDADGLLSAGADGMPVTWMNAKVGTWVVTPRVGKPVELNALWYNALRVVAALAERFGDAVRVRELGVLAGNAKISFNCRFWNDPAGCCHDVLSEEGGAESALRPNQVLAAGLPFPVLTQDRIERVVQTLREKLLTPLGLRTLTPEHPAYVGHYAGNALSRDRAHHNGSVHPWLLGPFVTAFLRACDGSDAARAQALEMLRPCLDRLCGESLGQLPELFDGETPHNPGGATACAPGVGELLRCYVEDVLGITPTTPLPTAEVPFGTLPESPLNEALPG
jgi:predicted glycogen debranching enzyme